MTTALLMACFTIYSGKVIHLNAGSPGSEADSTVFRRSDLGTALEYRRVADGYRSFLPPDHYIVCDQAYRIRAYQVKPFNDAKVCGDVEKIFFNHQQRRARRIGACARDSLIVRSLGFAS